jgi:hypothetical protein
MRMGRSLGFALCAVAGWLPLGCGSSYSQYCQDVMDCRNGNEKDVEACTIGADAEEDIASLEGCDSQYADFADCREEEGRCRDNNMWDEKSCDAQRQRWQDCIK